MRHRRFYNTDDDKQELIEKREAEMTSYFEIPLVSTKYQEITGSYFYLTWSRDTERCLTHVLKAYEKKNTWLVKQMLLVAGDKGRTALHLVAQEGDSVQAKFFIRDGADVNAQDEQGLTALHMTAEIGGLALMKLLIDKGANPIAKTKNGQTPLSLAAANSNISAVEYLLSIPIVSNQPDLGAQLSGGCFSEQGLSPLLYQALYDRKIPLIVKLMRYSEIEASVIRTAATSNCQYTRSLLHEIPPVNSMSIPANPLETLANLTIEDETKSALTPQTFKKYFEEQVLEKDSRGHINLCHLLKNKDIWTLMALKDNLMATEFQDHELLMFLEINLKIIERFLLTCDDHFIDWGTKKNNKVRILSVKIFDNPRTEFSKNITYLNYSEYAYEMAYHAELHCKEKLIQMLDRLIQIKSSP